MAVGNPLGAVCLFDGENPRTFTGKARETISGGQFVYVSGADATAQVGSQASSFKTEDLEIALKDKYELCNGMALTNTGSEGEVTIATRGTFLIKAGGAISGGQLLWAEEDCVQAISSTAAGSEMIGVIGRALTNAGSEDYVLASLNL